LSTRRGGASRARARGKERNKSDVEEEKQRGVAKERLERMIALKKVEVINIRADPGGLVGGIVNQVSPQPASSSPGSSAPKHTPSAAAAPKQTFADTPQADQPTAERQGVPDHAKAPSNQQSGDDSDPSPKPANRRSRMRSKR
jgi:hypothetical protein